MNTSRFKFEKYEKVVVTDITDLIGVSSDLIGTVGMVVCIGFTSRGAEFDISYTLLDFYGDIIPVKFYADNLSECLTPVFSCSTIVKINSKNSRYYKQTGDIAKRHATSYIDSTKHAHTTYYYDVILDTGKKICGLKETNLRKCPCGG